MRQAVLVSAVRTPVGKKGGVFKNLKRMDLFVPVIQEALKLQEWLRPAPAKQTTLAPPVALVTEENTKREEEYREDEPPENPPEEPKMEEPPEPEYQAHTHIETVVIAASAGRLLQSLSRLISRKYQEQDKKLRQTVDRKQRREIQEKKQAMGLRD